MEKEKAITLIPLNEKEALYECLHCHARPYISLHNCPEEPICHMCGEKLTKIPTVEKTVIYADKVPYWEIHKRQNEASTTSVAIEN